VRGRAGAGGVGWHGARAGRRRGRQVKAGQRGAAMGGVGRGGGGGMGTGVRRVGEIRTNHFFHNEWQVGNFYPKSH
jgi:hypothetical protein